VEDNNLSLIEAIMVALKIGKIESKIERKHSFEEVLKKIEELKKSGAHVKVEGQKFKDKWFE
jgi:hypothetical protein